MRNLQITKLAKVANTDAETLNMGIVAFQLINITLNYYGKIITDTLDTKIMDDGRQITINGNGYLPEGTEI